MTITRFLFQHHHGWTALHGERRSSVLRTRSDLHRGCCGLALLAFPLWHTTYTVPRGFYWVLGPSLGHLCSGSWPPRFFLVVSSHGACNGGPPFPVHSMRHFSPRHSVLHLPCTLVRNSSVSMGFPSGGFAFAPIPMPYYPF
jgi:hypothetical protein